MSEKYIKRNPNKLLYGYSTEKEEGGKTVRLLRQKVLKTRKGGIMLYNVTSSNKEVKSRRTCLVSNGIPGPGAYNTEKKEHVVNCIFPRGKKNIQKSPDNPSPLDYNPDPKFSSISYSIKKAKVRDTRIGIIPGPSHYNVKSCTLRRHPSYTIRKSSSPKRKPLTPGPGQYSTERPLKKSPSAVFDRSKRLKLFERPGTPGVGQFNLRREFKKGIAFERSKKDILHRAATPGPGTYQLPAMSWSKTARTFSKAY